MLRYERWARNNLDIVLDGATNGEWYARCPFTINHSHGDKNPSFGINVRKGVYYCHGCQERGNINQLAEKLRVGIQEDPPDIDDLDDLIDTLLSLDTNEALDEVKQYPEAWLDQFLVDEDAVDDYWMGSRHLSEKVVQDFKLGYDGLSNSATIPIRDLHGKPLGVIRRRLSKNAKPRYMYPKGFKISEHLWGANYCKGQSVVAVCEGSVDALACWSVDIPAVALLGSRISDHQVNLMNKLGCSEVVVMTDRDKPGREAARRVQDALSGVLVSVGRYRKSWEGKDPAAITDKQRVQMYEYAN